MSAFGPYLDEQTIDFSLLSGSGMFLISGNTGAGKTTILDAMTYALYETSSGANRGDISDMRCQYAKAGTDTYVEFTFSSGGTVYRASKRFSVNVAKSGKINSAIERCIFAADSEGTFVPLLEKGGKREAEEKIEAIIGLNADRFRQIIVLPQGQFERFLVADSSQKEDLLQSVFNTEKWNSAVEIIRRKLSADKTELENVKAIIKSVFDNLHCENLSELSEKLESDRRKLDGITAGEAVISEKVREVNERYAKAIALNELFLQKESLTLREKELFAQKSENDKLAQSLASSEKALKIRPVFDRLTDAQNELKRRTSSYGQEAALYENALTKYNNARKEADRYGALTAQYEEKRELLRKYTQMREVYKTIDEAKEAADNAEKNHTDLLKRIKTAESALENAEKEKFAKDEIVARMRMEYSELFDRYKKSVFGNIACELSDGTPCPVCGSIHHPSPAEKNDGDVDENTLKQKDNQTKEAVRHADAAAEARNNALSEKSGLYEALAETSSERTRTNTEYERLSAMLIAGISDLNALEDEIRNTDGDIQDFDCALKKVEERVNAAKEQALVSEEKKNSALSEKEKAEETVYALKEEFARALCENGFDDQTQFLSLLKTDEQIKSDKQKLEQYSAEILANKKSLDELNARLNDCEKPDILSLTNEKNIAEAEKEEFLKEAAVLKSEYEQLKLAYKAQKKRTLDYEKALALYQRRYDFITKIDSGTGISLRRYILGVMLTTVVHESNRLLSGVHNGRYKLYRTNERIGAKRSQGLALMVYDARSNERRPVNTLSGGEKFLVSLVLAISLSTVVCSQSGGIKIGAMFIDEGFGTLDSQSVADAMAVLLMVRKTDTLIGIISHVDALKENITARINVESAENGSKITLSV